MTLSAAEEIFLAMANVEPRDHMAFLDGRCAGDPGLRREVEAMVATLDAPGDEFLDPGLIPTLDMAAVDGPLQPGTNLGGYYAVHYSRSGEQLFIESGAIAPRAAVEGNIALMIELADPVTYVSISCSADE